MSWTRAELVALARLLRSARLVRSAGTRAVVDHAVAVGWATPAARAREVALADAGTAAIPALLDRRWPAWRDDVAALEAHGLPLDADGLRRLDQLRRLDGHLPLALPPRLNRRTAQARWARHSKTPLASEAQARLGALALTTDDVVRLRPHAGLALRLGDRVVEDPAALTGEVVLPERALLDGLTLAGAPPRLVVTVENLGAYVDLPAPPDALVVWLPGWNSPLALRVLDLVAPAAHLHFGDLDPIGAEIVAHLRTRGRAVDWFVPDFWAEYAPTHALPCVSPWPAAAPDWPPLVRELAAAGRWMEQEAIVPDPRLAAALAASAADPLNRAPPTGASAARPLLRRGRPGPAR